jgi:hypothetical protein
VDLACSYPCPYTYPVIQLKPALLRVSCGASGNGNHEFRPLDKVEAWIPAYLSSTTPAGLVRGRPGSKSRLILEVVPSRSCTCTSSALDAQRSLE